MSRTGAGTHANPNRDEWGEPRPADGARVRDKWPEHAGVRRTRWVRHRLLAFRVLQLGFWVALLTELEERRELDAYHLEVGNPPPTLIEPVNSN